MKLKICIGILFCLSTNLSNNFLFAQNPGAITESKSSQIILNFHALKLTQLGNEYRHSKNITLKNELLDLSHQYFKLLGYRATGIMDTVEHYFKFLPFLHDSYRHNLFRVNVYTCAIMDRPHLVPIEKRLSHLPMFKKSVEGLARTEGIRMTIGEVYESFIKEYMRKGDMKKARFYLDEGLTVDPDNYLLLKLLSDFPIEN